MLAELGCVVMGGGMERGSVHEWPVIENERRCRIILECVE